MCGGGADNMRPFEKHTGIVMPLARMNVDTDQIIPKQFLKSVKRTGFGENLFNDWRFLPDGAPNPEFVLNDERYRGASILATLHNFGSGSSREHAVWALQQFGFRAVVAPSFADIFKSNCHQNGLLPIELAEADVDAIIKNAETRRGYSLTVDLAAETLADDAELRRRFQIDAFRKECLLNGYDDISLTLQHEKEIRQYEQKSILAKR